MENKELEQRAREFYLFKVKDYTTVLMGKMTDDGNKYYVERGDGTKYEYWADELEWSKPVSEIITQEVERATKKDRGFIDKQNRRILADVEKIKQLRKTNGEQAEAIINNVKHIKSLKEKVRKQNEDIEQRIMKSNNQIEYQSQLEEEVRKLTQQHQATKEINKDLAREVGTLKQEVERLNKRERELMNNMNYKTYVKISEELTKYKEIFEKIKGLDSYDLELTGPPHMETNKMIKTTEYQGDWIKWEEIEEILINE